MFQSGIHRSKYGYSLKSQNIAMTASLMEVWSPEHRFSTQHLHQVEIQCVQAEMTSISYQKSWPMKTSFSWASAWNIYLERFPWANDRRRNGCGSAQLTVAIRTDGDFNFSPMGSILIKAINNSLYRFSNVNYFIKTGGFFISNFSFM